MDLRMQVYSAMCHLSVFTINGINADENDFVDKYDHDEENAEDYGCGDMRADILPATEEVLIKYGISITEYNEIASKVSEELSFGCCGWCV